MLVPILIVIILGMAADAEKCISQRPGDAPPVCNKDNELPVSIEDLIDVVDNFNDTLSLMCLEDVQCCAKATNLSLHKYVYHSLALEGIDNDENSLLKTSTYQDSHLEFENLTIEQILSVHKMLFNGKGGQFRKKNVAVRNPITSEIYSMPSYQSVDEKMKKYVESIRTQYNNMHPIQAAVLVKLNFVKTHPFEDGNGRISRLLYNLWLRKQQWVGWTTFYASDLAEYYDSITSATKDFGLNQFLKYSLTTIHKSQKDFYEDYMSCVRFNQ